MGVEALFSVSLGAWKCAELVRSPGEFYSRNLHVSEYKLFIVDCR